MTSSQAAIAVLVERFRKDFSNLTHSGDKYQETEVRVEYIDPLFSALGWDTANAQGIPKPRRDVLREPSKRGKRPDYLFRVRGVEWFYVEAKRPSVDIRTHLESAFQIRTYGFTQGHSIGVLTNFRTLRIYDTLHPLRPGDDADTALILSVDFPDFEARFSEIDQLLGRHSVASGFLAENFPRPQGTSPASKLFFERLNDWRLRICADLHARYPNLSGDELSDLSQKLINRIVFIRMCEDRGIEGEEVLRTAAKGGFVELRTLFRTLDKRYNTGLFRVDGDGFQKACELSSNVLTIIVDEIYAPNAPYSFGVLDADFLGQVYERFLIDRLVVDGGEVRLQPKPAYENREVVTTPQPLVDEIVRRAVAHRLQEVRDTPALVMDAIRGLKVLDIAVGSGRFLLRAFDELVSIAAEACVAAGRMDDVYCVEEGDYRLRFGQKCDILRMCLYGIDIDYHAVEVARFSLLVRLLEDEGEGTLPAGDKILPDLDNNIVRGNTVVAGNFSSADGGVMARTSPMDWATAKLPASFDIVLGNPPYMKTEDMITFNPEEFEYFKATYETPFKQFDKYFVFLERAIAALRDDGTCGLVVPNKWLTGVAGKRLRTLLAQDLAQEIVDFGTANVFEGNMAYVCLLLLYRDAQRPLDYRYVKDIAEFLEDPVAQGVPTPRNRLPTSGDAWMLAADATEALTISTLLKNSKPLGEIAEIKNGIQTSADDVYLISNHTAVGNKVIFEKAGVRWEIEAAMTRPHIKDSGVVSSYGIVRADSLVIFPYASSNGAAVLVPPDTMMKDYPLAFAYLSSYRDRLAKRKMKLADPDAFYPFGRHQALETVFLSPKIIYSVNQRGGKYALDEVGTSYASGGTAGEVAITAPTGGYALEFILGLLNQWPMEVFARRRGSPFKGGWFSRGSAVASDFPVPNLDVVNSAADRDLHDRIVALVKALIAHHGRLPGAHGRAREDLLRKMEGDRRRLADAFNEIWELPPEALHTKMGSG